MIFEVIKEILILKTKFKKGNLKDHAQKIKTTKKIGKSRNMKSCGKTSNCQRENRNNGRTK